ncbi:MAG TPA: AAA family ATPase [Syntrophales bacterium]|jgi:general secretion pathway protein A|nr:AAA family ATPase [Syntrophales bacterium]
MYAAYYGLKENPFNLSPDPRYFFPGHRHQEALNHLVYGVREKKGFILLTGDVGTGKTTVCRSFLAGLDDTTTTALIFNSFLSEMELLETLAQEFGFEVSLNGGEKTRKRYLDALNDFLLRNFIAGRNTVLLIDEAQNLSHGVLEQIRMLSNLETEREKLIQIVLIGQPELRDLLLLPVLRQLNERITVRYHLESLDLNHVRAYIEHRLSVGGGRGRIKFTPFAYRLIHAYSQGVPRRINAICDRCLLIAYARDGFAVDGKTVKDAIKDMGPHYRRPKRRFFKFLD